MQTDISVLHAVAGLHPNAGGPSRTVVQLADSLALEANIAIALLSQTLAGEPTLQPTLSKVVHRAQETDSRAMLALGLPLQRGLDDLSRRMRPDLIHNHGLWLPANTWVARMARREKIPLLIHPRGMLEPWALQYHGWKKQLALRLYQRRDLETATLFFATAEQEADSIRRLGLRQPIAVIPNGVELPVADHNKYQQQPPSLPGKPRTAVFMSRIHPKKGLLNLLDAWSQVNPPGWCLLLAGPDEGGHLAEVMQRIRALGLDASVKYVGEVEGETKSVLLESADLFVLPSFSENFGVVVAEALAHGVPVITTRGTPWKGLLQHGCGWWVEPTVDALSGVLREALSMDPTALQAMGEKGRFYAAEFNWTHIAQQTAEVYRWVLGQGPKPACVVCG